jgi:hypothetical protein
MAPLSPQAVFAVPGLHWLFSQQPLGQLAGVHTHEPFWHTVPLGQATQATPLVPQCWLLLVWHWLFWQQPFGQLVALHTH